MEKGASRYYKEGFALECKAMKRVREEMGLTNLVIMVPFCRRVDEGERVLAEMAKNGLTQLALGVDRPDSVMKITLKVLEMEQKL